MKRVCSALGVVAVFLSVLSGCFFPPPPPPPPTATFEITSWEQNYYEYSGDFGYVYVYFKVTNTGAVDIDYYQVYFEVTCRDGSTYQDWTNGSNVKTGKALDDWTMLNTADKEAVSIVVSDYELTSYSW